MSKQLLEQDEGMQVLWKFYNGEETQLEKTRRGPGTSVSNKCPRYDTITSPGNRNMNLKENLP